jgi:hypothetical protein
MFSLVYSGSSGTSSPLANSWRQLADALAHPALTVQNGASEPSRPDMVVVDLSPLREGRAVCVQARDACVALAAPFAASLARDDTESASETNDELLERAIWQHPSVLLEFVLPDRPTAKAFAVRVYQCIGSKQSMQFKLEDFMMPEFEFDFFANASDQVFDIYLPDIS